MEGEGTEYAAALGDGLLEAGGGVGELLRQAAGVEERLPDLPGRPRSLARSLACALSLSRAHAHVFSLSALRSPSACPLVWPRRRAPRRRALASVCGLRA